jgi:uncharacterized coiled-coil DUF342 family protein
MKNMFLVSLLSVLTMPIAGVCNISDCIAAEQIDQDELRRDIPELKREIPELRRDIPELRREIPELRREIPELRRDIPELKQDPRSGERLPI